MPVITRGFNAVDPAFRGFMNGLAAEGGFDEKEFSSGGEAAEVVWKHLPEVKSFWGISLITCSIRIKTSGKCASKEKKMLKG